MDIHRPVHAALIDITSDIERCFAVADILWVVVVHVVELFSSAQVIPY
jgi:hypothetical protein